MKSAEKCPSFTVISAAADGDTQAIEKILKHRSEEHTSELQSH